MNMTIILSGSYDLEIDEIKEGAMKAMVHHDYGSPDHLVLAEIDMPPIKDDEVLVKVRAASLNWLDWHFLTDRPFLARLSAVLLKPKNKILGKG